MVTGTDGSRALKELQLKSLLEADEVMEECLVLEYPGPQYNRLHDQDYRLRHHSDYIGHLMRDHDAPYLIEWWVTERQGSHEPEGTTVHYRKDDAFLGGIIAHSQAALHEDPEDGPAAWHHLARDLPNTSPGNAVVAHSEVRFPPSGADDPLHRSDLRQASYEIAGAYVRDLARSIQLGLQHGQ